MLRKPKLSEKMHNPKAASPPEKKPMTDGISTHKPQGLQLTSGNLANLHTFECAARHLNFTTAAEELCLTQSAVSHRINKLEQQLGLRLFIRLHKQLRLSSEGQQLSVVVREALQRLDEEIRRAKSSELSGSVTLFAHPSIVQCWLVPKLSDFTSRFPAIKLDIQTGNETVNFRTQQVDLALYYANGFFPGLYSVKLMEEEIMPVCSRKYAEQHDLIGKPENLQRCNLLHDTHAWHHSSFNAEWRLWAEANGLADQQFESGVSFDRSDLAVIAAINDVGVAIGRRRIVEKRLGNRELIAPFENLMAKASYSYYLVLPKKEQPPRVSVLIQWLMEQAGQGGNWQEQLSFSEGALQGLR